MDHIYCLILGATRIVRFLFNTHEYCLVLHDRKPRKLWMALQWFTTTSHTSFFIQTTVCVNYPINVSSFVKQEKNELGCKCVESQWKSVFKWDVAYQPWAVFPRHWADRGGNGRQEMGVHDYTRGSFVLNDTLVQYSFQRIPT